MKSIEFTTSSERTASCLVYSKATSKWLVIQRSEYEDSPLTWTLPGGHLEKGEDYITAAIRECKEEAGIDISNVPYSLIYAVKTDWPLILHKTFAFCIKDEIEPTLNWEAVDYQWCDLNNLPVPLHWSLDYMLNSDKAAERLHNWLQST